MENRRGRERTEMVALTVSAAEKEMLEKLRAKEGMSRSAYLRYLLRAEDKRQKTREGEINNG